MTNRFLIYTLIFSMVLLSCNDSNKRDINIDDPKSNNLKTLSSKNTGILFSNDLVLTEEFNPYTFKSFLNGGGVALGDINNDGLLDVYLSGNLVENKLYLNSGNLKFTDITEKSGLTCPNVWSTGISMVDINHDGFLDVYVCKSGQPNTPNRSNQIFINNHDLTFTDMSKEYGLDFVGLSVHSAFFDYDKDGDLDCYLLNNSIRSVGNYDIATGLRETPDEKGGNKLLKNLEVETGEIKFVDVSTQSGIYTSAIGFGLGVSISDVNGDGWDDMFVSNDFFERDYLYLNNQDGTFKEAITESMTELSLGSMGADIADLNNDARPEIFVTEMLPETMRRYKTKTAFESFDKSQLNATKGYHNQFGRNVLQYNVGNKNNIPQFKELGRYHNIEATDWSWGALMADFDNNGYKDIFVANGIKKDLLDQDHVSFYTPQKLGNLIKGRETNIFKNMIESFPSYPINNYYYKQISLDSFVHIPFNDSEKGFSNGSAYGDLDNDGDLDLIVNNIDKIASVVENTTEENHFIQFKLSGGKFNSHGIGTKIKLYVNGEVYFAENNPMRGYQSCIDPKLHFGLGNITTIDSVHIEWPDMGIQKLNNLAADSLYLLSQNAAAYETLPKTKINSKTFLTKVDPLFKFIHKENNFADFDKNRIQNYFLSNESPSISIGDINNDQLNDVVISNSKDAPNLIFTQKNGKFGKGYSSFSDINIEKETSDILIEDLNVDGLNDLYTVNGSVEFSRESSNIKDDVFFGLEDERIEKSKASLSFQQGCCAAVIKKTSGKSKLLLVAPRINGSVLGLPTKMSVYKFEKNVVESNMTLSKSFEDVGMVTDIIVGNIEGDSESEIIVASQFKPISIYKLNEENTVDKLTNTGLDGFAGNWNDLVLEDVDNDGDNDIIALNLGINNRLHNMSNGELYLFTNDFDSNGDVDNVYCYKNRDKFYPIHLREEMIMQMPAVKKKVLKYADYADASLTDIFGDAIVKRSLICNINEFNSGIFYNDNGSFTFVPLPKEVQYSEQKAVWCGDINNDGWNDLIIGGNQYKAQPHIGMNAASFGHVLLNDKTGKFVHLSMDQSGLFEKGQIRDIESINVNGVTYLLIAKNNAPMSFYKINN